MDARPPHELRVCRMQTNYDGSARWTRNERLGLTPQCVSNADALMCKKHAEGSLIHVRTESKFCCFTLGSVDKGRGHETPRCLRPRNNLSEDDIKGPK